MKKMINVGDNAPKFGVEDIWERSANIPQKSNWTYISFHRFAACPFCNLRTNQLIHHHGNFIKNNIKIISVWPSSKENLLRYAGKDKTPFLMVSNENKSIYIDYGVTESSIIAGFKLFLHPKTILEAIGKNKNKIKIDSDPKLLPASFLIDPNGVVKMAYYGKHFGDHPEIENVLQLTKEL